MKKNLFRQIISPVYMLALVTLLVSSCREESDLQTNYGNDDVVVSTSITNFATSFKALWEGLNNGYTLWDYEEELGVDWDGIYETYYPQFEALDTRTDSVSDDEVIQLMKASFGQLHDGHMMLKMKNFSTDNLLSFSPQSERIKARDDFEAAQIGTQPLTAYLQATDDNQVVSYNETHMEFGTFVSRHLSESWRQDSVKIDSLEKITPRTDTIIYQLMRHKMLKQEIDAIFTKHSVGMTQYNTMVSSYADLKIPALVAYDPTLLSNMLYMRYARFKDNILYLSLSGFTLSPFMNDDVFVSTFGLASASATEAAQQVKTVYGKWFDDIQSLKKAGKLKGIIIDMRGNGGGYTDDNQYVMGSLLPSGGYQFAESRTKNGLGRLDYSPCFPFSLNTRETEHETIEQEPVVVLTNCRTVSMAELTSLEAKKMSNGIVIGKRTYGGLCTLFGHEARNCYNLAYAGNFGDFNNGPIFAYVPYLGVISEYGILESQGVKPDIEENLDLNLLKNEGRDSQLERALQYIRTGN